MLNKYVLISRVNPLSSVSVRRKEVGKLLHGPFEFFELCKCQPRLIEDDGETCRMKQADNVM